MVGAILPLLLTKAEWPGFRIPEVDMAFRMPSKPTPKETVFMNSTAVFYTADALEGRFVAGYVRFPDAAQPTMQKQIHTDPGGVGIKGLLQATVAAFAKGGKAKIADPQFGIDQGLPTEFATLEGGKMNLRVRVYIGVKATYTFITNAGPEMSAHYFNSIKLPHELGQKQ